MEPHPSSYIRPHLKNHYLNPHKKFEMCFHRLDEPSSPRARTPSKAHFLCWKCRLMAMLLVAWVVVLGTYTRSSLSVLATNSCKVISWRGAKHCREGLGKKMRVWRLWANLSRSWALGLKFKSSVSGWASPRSVSRDRIISLTRRFWWLVESRRTWSSDWMLFSWVYKSGKNKDNFRTTL